MPDIAPPTREVMLQRTELRCRAAHPSGPRIERFRDRIHNAVLGVSPFSAIPTGRILAHETEVMDGFIPAYCPDCKRYTEYEVVYPARVLEQAS